MAHTSTINDKPIIGILTQKIPYNYQEYNNYFCFIAASYVKLLEGGGARVLPVWIGQNENYYRDIINKTNGIFFPGGTEWFNQTEGYAEAGKIIYKIAIEQNEGGHYYPLFGICMGFELMMYCDAKKDVRRKCSAMNVRLTLEFERGHGQSKMFKDASEKIIKTLESQEVTSHFHNYCYDLELLEELGIANNWRIVTTSTDKNGFKFISSIESIKYPFYAIQYHPEKNMYEWIDKEGIVHTEDAIFTSQYFARFFVNEARKSNHTFADRNEEKESLIYNFFPTYTGLQDKNFMLGYFFHNRTKSDDINEV